MKNWKNLALNLVKMLGLLVLVVVSNQIPILFLTKSEGLASYLEVLLVLAYALVLGLIFRTLWKHYRAYLSQEVLDQTYTWKDFGINLLYFLGGRVITVLIYPLYQSLSGQQQTVNDAALSTIAGFMSQDHLLFSLTYVIMLAFLGPIMEELVFRGFGIVLFFKPQHKLWAALTTSFLFAVLHITSWLELPIYMLLGLLVYTSYARRGNLKDSITVHILNNLPIALLFLLSMFYQ